MLKLNEFISKHLGVCLLGFVLIASLFVIVVQARADTDAAWDTTFEALPGNSDNFSEGPLRIRDDKTNVRGRLETGHYFGQNTADDNGQHAIGSARCWIQNTAPTVIHQEDFNPAASGNDALGTVGTGAATELTGFGRCWIDRDGVDNTIGTYDDHSVWIYDQDPDGDADFSDAAWVAVESPTLFYTGGNLLSCGSFDCMVTSADAAPHQGRWAESISGTISYITSQFSEGLSIALQVSTSNDGDSVTYELDALKTLTTYFVTARVRKVSGDGSCGVKTNNISGTEMTEVTHTATAYASITGTFITGATIASAPQIDLETNVTSGTVVCNFDHVGVFQVPPDPSDDFVIDNPGNLVVYETSQTEVLITDTEGGGTPWADTDLFATEIKVPNDGYYVKVNVSVCLGQVYDTDGEQDALFGVRLKREGTEVARAFFGVDQNGDSIGIMGQLNIAYVDMAPEPEVLYDYDVEVTVECNPACVTGTADGAVNPGSTGATDTFADGSFADSDNACEFDDTSASSWILIEAVRAY